jgi:hypothetical protein
MTAPADAAVTGLTEPVRKQPSDPVLSGSAVVAGTARIRADRRRGAGRRRALTLWRRTRLR